MKLKPRHSPHDAGIAPDRAVDDLSHARRDLRGKQQAELVADAGKLGRQSYRMEGAAHPGESGLIRDPQASGYPR